MYRLQKYAWLFIPVWKLLTFLISFIWIFQLCLLHHLWHLGAYNIQKLTMCYARYWVKVSDSKHEHRQKTYLYFFWASLYLVAYIPNSSSVIQGHHVRSCTADQCRLIKIFPPDLAVALSQSLPVLCMFLAWTCCFTMDFCTWETIFTWFEQILYMANLLTVNMLFLANTLDESTVRGVLSIKFENELVSFQSGCSVSITNLEISTQYCIACGIWEYLKETKVQLQLPRYSDIFF